jgi:hypothetical protein
MSRTRTLALIATALIAGGPAIGMTGPVLAQSTTPPPADTMESAPDTGQGPVVGGRHRQPSRAEIEERERAQGRSADSIAREERNKDREVDELYRQLMTDPNASRPADSGSTR